MAFRYKLTHHPAAAADFQCAKDYFAEIDEDLAGLFQTDFRVALRGIATGRLASHLYAAGNEKLISGKDVWKCPMAYGGS